MYLIVENCIHPTKSRISVYKKVMGAVKHGIFFFLLSKILAVDLNTSTNSIQLNGKNGGVPNSWTSQPYSVSQIPTSSYNPLIPYPQESTYMNNNGNQQHINYDQYSPMAQTYNKQHNINSPQQFIPQKQYYSQPIPPGPFNSNRESVNQQLTNMQYSHQDVNTKLQQPVINQKNENYQLQIPHSYNLYPPSQSKQEASQSFGTAKPPLPKEYQTQSPTRFDHPITEKELQDARELLDSGEGKTYTKNNENKPEQISTKIIPQFSQKTEFNSKSELPGTYFVQSKSPLPSENQSQLSQVQPQGSLKPLKRVSSTTNENTKKIKNGVLINPKQELQDNKFSQTTQNKLPPSQMASQSSLELLNKGPTTPNKNTLVIEDSKPFDSQLQYPNGLSLPQTQNELNLPQSSHSAPLVSNQLPLSQIPSHSSSELLNKEPPSLNIHFMQNKNDNVPLNSLSEFPDDTSKPFTSNVAQSEKHLIDSLQTDLKKILNPEINDNLLKKDNSQLELNDTPPQLLMDNTQVGNDPQQGGLIKGISEIPQPTQNKLPLYQKASQSSLELLNKGPTTPNKNTLVIEDSKPFDSQLQYPNGLSLPQTQNELNLPQSSHSAPFVSNQLPLSQIPSHSSSELLNKEPPSLNIHFMQNQNDNVPLNSLSEFPDDTSKPFTSNVAQSEKHLIDSLQTDLKKILNPEINDNLLKKDNSQLELNDTPPQLLMDNTQVGNDPQQGGLIKGISEIPQPTQNKLPLYQKASQSSLELLNKGPTTPNKNTLVIEDSKPFDSQLQYPNGLSLPQTQNELNLPQSSHSAPFVSNQLPLSQIPSHSSSELLNKEPPSLNIHFMQNQNDNVPLNSLSEFPDDTSKPFTSNVAQSEKHLIDSLQTDLKKILNPEINDNLLKKDNSQLELNDTPPQLLMDNTQVGNDPQQGGLIKGISEIPQPTQNKLPLYQKASQSSLELLNKGPTTPNKNTLVIEDSKPFDSQLQYLNGLSLPQTQNELNLPQSSHSAPFVSNQLPLSQIPSHSSSELLNKEPPSLNIHFMQNQNDNVPLNSLSEFPDDTSKPFTSNVAQSEKHLIDSLQTDLKKILNPEINDNLLKKDNSQLELNDTPPQLLMDNTQVGNDPQQGGLIKGISEIPQPTQNKLPLYQKASQSSLELLNKGPTTPNKNTLVIEDSKPFDSQLQYPNGLSLPQTQNELNLPQSSHSAPFVSNQLPLSQIPSHSSSELLNKEPPSLNIHFMQNQNDNVPLNSLSEFPDDTSKPFTSNVAQSEKHLIDSLQTDLKKILNPEINDNLLKKDNSQLELNDTPPQLLMDNTQVGNDPQQGGLIKGISEIPQPTQNKLPLYQKASQSSLELLNKGPTTPNKNTLVIEDSKPFDSQLQYLNGLSLPQTQNELNLPQSSHSAPFVSNQLPLSQIPSHSSSELLNKEPPSLNIHFMQNQNDNVPLNSLSEFPDDTSKPFTSNVAQSEKHLIDSLQTDLKKILNPEINDNLLKKDNSQLELNDTPPQLLMDNTQVGNDPQQGGLIKGISEIPQPTQNKLPLYQKASQSSLELLNKGPTTPNKNTLVIEDSKPFDSQLQYPNGLSLPQTQNELNLPQSSHSAPFVSNQLPLSQIPSHSSSELLNKEPPSLNIHFMQNQNDNVPLNSLSEFPDDTSKPFTSNVAQSEKHLIDSLQTDLKKILNPEINDNLLKKDNSQLELNDTPPQLLMDNTQVGNDPQQGGLIKGIGLYGDTQKSQIPLHESPLPVSATDTQLNEELEKAVSESPVFLLNKDNEENYSFNSLEDLVFDESLENGLSKYAKSDIGSTENLKIANQDKAKISVLANPNDIHTLKISPIHPPTSDNNYSKTNYLLNSPPAYVPWYKPSFPNTVNYIQQPDLNANNQLLSSLLNAHQYPLFYSQIPMYPPIKNYYNQQDAYSAVVQNQITPDIHLPGFSRNSNQPSFKDNTGSIYKKVDLRNPPKDSSNSWSLLNKDYTRNSNQDNGFTSYDGKTRTSTIGTPLTSYQNNIQEISSLSSNDMFVQNMMPMNSFYVPLAGTKEIFDVTRANFPRAPLSHIIRLTNSIVQSVMRSLQQTLNTVMNSSYGYRSKRDVNPYEALHNLPGALIDKYSQKSTITPTSKYYKNKPYYTQPDSTGKQLIEYDASQPIESTLQQQQRQMYYGGVTNMNYYGARDNNNMNILPQPVNIQNHVLNSIVDAIIPAIRSNMPYPYLTDTPEVKEYTQQVIVTVGKVFENQIDNLLYGRPPTMNV